MEECLKQQSRLFLMVTDLRHGHLQDNDGAVQKKAYKVLASICQVGLCSYAPSNSFMYIYQHLIDVTSYCQQKKHLVRNLVFQV
jgi:hypothetical protein